MLDPKLLRSHANEVAEKLAKRGFKLDVSYLAGLEEQRKQLQVKVQDLQNERNKISKAVGQAKAQGQDATSLLQQVKEMGETLKSSDERLVVVQNELNKYLALVPNLPHESVPTGSSEEENVVVRTVGAPTQFHFTPKDHVDLGVPLGMDFACASKISGARFVVLRNKLAKLSRALAQFMLDVHVNEHGYEEMNVPLLVNADSLFGTGQLPKMQDDLFMTIGASEMDKIDVAHYYLIPTSEVSVTNTVRDEILENLPLKYVCYSPCFRSEAGSYGKDVKGMIRQHQFEKVELVHIVHPDKSYEALEEMTGHAEKILQKLKLPYRVVALCTGDLGFAAAKTYDLEVWLPGQQRYREISSCSNTESFQARRLKARFRDSKTNKTELVHTLNGSGLAVGRTLVAVLENYQDEQGRVHVPEVLRPYMNGLSVIE